jgi:hypothetical protein
MTTNPIPVLGAALIAAFAFASASCGGGFLDAAARGSADPVVVKPGVSCFMQSRLVDISWEADDAADEYILERALDIDSAGDPISYSVLYRGTDRDYRDVFAADNRYLYRLSKTRGQRIFGPSAPVLAFSTMDTRDGFEPNDTQGQATPLSYQCDANIQFYKSGTGEVSTDVDWYYVDVPMRSVTYLYIHQVSPSSNNGDPTRLLYSTGLSGGAALQDVDIQLTNARDSTLRMYLAVNTDAATALGQTIGGGGIVIAYFVKVKRTESL